MTNMSNLLKQTVWIKQQIPQVNSTVLKTIKRAKTIMLIRISTQQPALVTTGTKLYLGKCVWIQWKKVMLIFSSAWLVKAWTSN